MSPEFGAIRGEFPLLSHKTFLNSGSYCALANSVRAAFEAYLDDRLAVGADWDLWVMKNEAVRSGVATVLGVSADEIAVTTSASAGLNSLASAIDFSGARNKVLVTDFEFPTSAQIWHAQASRGARVTHVPAASDDYIPLEHFERLIDEQTKIVAVTHVCYRNGAKLDVAGVARLAHAKGALLALDCYQSVGSNPVDPRGWDVDFAVGGMLKYLLGTAGIGFLYVRGDLIEALTPTNSGWFAQADIGAMDIRRNTPSPSARRFEAGTPPVVNCYAAEAGLALINDIGTDAIGARVEALTGLCLERLEAIGWPSVTPRQAARRGPMIAIPTVDGGGLAARLMARDIVTSHRNDNLRAGFHFYNNEDDIEAFIQALADNRQAFQRR
jgi:selenocysteine lyase/cysteine desulfurase